MSKAIEAIKSAQEWHFHDSQAGLFASLPPYDGTYDGHDTPEKYRRVSAESEQPRKG